MFIPFIICSKIKNLKEGGGRTRTSDKLRAAIITGSKKPSTKEENKKNLVKNGIVPYRRHLCVKYIIVIINHWYLLRIV